MQKRLSFLIVTALIVIGFGLQIPLVAADPAPDFRTHVELNNLKGVEVYVHQAFVYGWVAMGWVSPEEAQEAIIFSMLTTLDRCPIHGGLVDVNEAQRNPDNYAFAAAEQILCADLVLVSPSWAPAVPMDDAMFELPTVTGDSLDSHNGGGNTKKFHFGTLTFRDNVECCPESKNGDGKVVIKTGGTSYKFNCPDNQQTGDCNTDVDIYIDSDREFQVDVFDRDPTSDDDIIDVRPDTGRQFGVKVNLNTNKFTTVPGSCTDVSPGQANICTMIGDDGDDSFGFDGDDGSIAFYMVA